MSEASSQKAQVYFTPPEDFSPYAEAAGCYLLCNGKFLFQQRSSICPQPHTWGVPGGKLEDGETAAEAVIREVREETGVEICSADLRELGPLYIRGFPTDYIFHLFTVECRRQPKVTLSKETQGFCWVTKEQALKLPLISAGAEALQIACERAGYASESAVSPHSN